MKRKRYFTHTAVIGTLYRFSLNKTDDGGYFDPSGRYPQWRADGWVTMFEKKNWTRLSRDEARKQFPEAFRKA